MYPSPNSQNCLLQMRISLGHFLAESSLLSPIFLSVRSSSLQGPSSFASCLPLWASSYKKHPLFLPRLDSEAIVSYLLFCKCTISLFSSRFCRCPNVLCYWWHLVHLIATYSATACKKSYCLMIGNTILNNLYPHMIVWDLYLGIWLYTLTFQ